MASGWILRDLRVIPIPPYNEAGGLHLSKGLDKNKYPSDF